MCEAQQGSSQGTILTVPIRHSEGSHNPYYTDDFESHTAQPQQNCDLSPSSMVIA